MSESVVMSKEKWIELRSGIQTKAQVSNMAATVPELIDLVQNLSFENTSDPSLLSSILDGSVEGTVTTEMLGAPYRLKSYSFCNRRGLTGIEIPDTVQRIGDYCFYGCKNLTEIVINKASSNLSGIEQDAITGGYLDPLGVNAFQGCGITSISLPATITKIPNYCFRDCTALKDLDIDATQITSLGTEAFMRVGSNYSDEDLDSLKTFISTMAVTAVPRYAFVGITASELTISDKVQNIEFGAFGSNTALTTITFKGTPTYINANAFAGCFNVKVINVPWNFGEISNAPWGASNATVVYNYTIME